MKKPVWLSVISACATLACIGGVSAQDGEPTGLVEIFSCSYVGNNDMDDLLGVTARWNAWADQRNLSSYTAVIMSPYFFSNQLELEVGWIGISPSGAAAGASGAQWLGEGQAMQAQFDAVVDCPSHAEYATVPISMPEPAEGDANGPGLLSFSDCAIRENRNGADALAALGEWAEYLGEMGVGSFQAALFPIAGERDDINYDFKAVQAFQDAEARGRFLDVYTAGGFLRAQAIFDPVLDCDSPRVYATQNVRQAAPAQ
jgi:hypothetical protein